jgi:hydrogenase nickel incorporation protein HypA/HybF
MHELSIALSIIDTAAEEAERQSAIRVTAVHMRLGPLSGVVKEALLSAYDLAREGTSLSGAELMIEDVPVVAHCPSCAGPRTLTTAYELLCPDCGTPTPELVSGRELEVVALEVE